jgi:tight adherence protein C
VQGALSQITSYGFEKESVLGIPRVARVHPINALGARVLERLGDERQEQTRRLLLSAGLYDLSAETFTGYRVLGAAAVPLLMLQLAVAGGKPALAFFLLAIGATIGWRLPAIVLDRRAGQRRTLIDRGMPELVDLLVVGVESGIGFNGAIRAASDRVGGPLGEELRLMHQEQTLGVSSLEALSRIQERCDTPAVRSFVRTIANGEKLGISVGQVLRGLASEMRKRRKATAEEQAHKAPVKILFPLVFLIFPSIFIVLLTPAVIQIVSGLSGAR